MHFKTTTVSIGVNGAGFVAKSTISISMGLAETEVDVEIYGLSTMIHMPRIFKRLSASKQRELIHSANKQKKLIGREA